jgi:hypothetical protein
MMHAYTLGSDGKAKPFQEQLRTLKELLSRYSTYDVEKRKNFMTSCLRKGWIKSVPSGSHRVYAAGECFEEGGQNEFKE